MKTVAAWVLALLVVIGVGVAVEAGAGVGNGLSGTLGRVCGVTAPAGGVVAGVQDPSLLHSCPSGASGADDAFKLVNSEGVLYQAYRYPQTPTSWSAILPAGSDKVIDSPGCPRPGRPFVVTAGRTLLGVVVWFGCLWP